MSAIKPSIYSTVTITSQDNRDVDFRLACVSIDIYEDVMVPSLSARIQVANAGGVIKDSSGTAVSLYDGLKIRGGEEVQILIEPNSANNEAIDFIREPLYVRGVRNLMREAGAEFFNLSLVTRQALENETKFVKGAFSKSGMISEHVRTILKENFTLGTRKPDVDDTVNPLGFIGNQMHPFDIITRLASKSVFGGNTGGSAGFFFYQTRDGFKFKSIDSLNDQSPKATYVYTEKNYNSTTFKPTPDLPSLDYKITSYQLLHNQDLIEQMKKGTYATDRRFMDPFSFQVTETKEAFTGKDYVGKVSNLGQRFDPTDIAFRGSTKSFMEEPSQIITEIFDRGTIEEDVNDELTKDIREYLSQAKMRYNSLFTQMVRLQVPLNSTLRAGDLIECKFPKIMDGANIRFEKEQVSGIYMIKELCHHFDSRASYTAMLLVRDTFGKKQ